MPGNQGPLGCAVREDEEYEEEGIKWQKLDLFVWMTV